MIIIYDAQTLGVMGTVLTEHHKSTARLAKYLNINRVTAYKYLQGETYNNRIFLILEQDIPLENVPSGKEGFELLLFGTKKDAHTYTYNAFYTFTKQNIILLNSITEKFSEGEIKEFEKLYSKVFSKKRTQLEQIQKTVEELASKLDLILERITK